MQNKVLIVDGDTRSLRLLEVSCKQVGYRVTTATSGVDALGQLEVEIPDLVLADTAIGEVDGFALYGRLQQRPEWAYLPFILILDGDNPAEKLRAVQLGVTDFLTRPLFLKEALSRVELLLEKQAQRGERGPGQTSSGRARFAGVLSGTALLDLLQTMELGRKSGIAYCVSGRGQRAAIYFADGVVVDAELGRLSGTEALYRILTFPGGEYRVELLTVVRAPRIEIGAPGLLMEAMRYLEEWNRQCAALPPLTAPLTPLYGTAGALRPEALPAELRDMLRLFDGRRSVFDVLDLLDEEAPPPHDALARLGMVAKLYAARLLTPAGRPVSGEPRAAVPTPLAVPLLTPSPRLTPPPLPRLTPPPLPRLTPPPLVGGRAAVLASLGRPTPVALPRAVVKTPAPIGDSGTLTLPEDLLITLVPGHLPRPAEQRSLHRTTDAGSSDESLTPLPPPFPPVGRPTPPPMPNLREPRPTPPPMPSLREPRLTPPMPNLREPRLTPPMPNLREPRLTPPPMPNLREPRLTPPPMANLREPRRTPPPMANLREPRLTPPPMPNLREPRLTPPPVLNLREPRLTPPPVLNLREPRLTPAMAKPEAELAEAEPAGTMPPLAPVPRELRITPVVAMEPARLAMQSISEPGLARLTPPPIPEARERRLTPAAAMKEAHAAMPLQSESARPLLQPGPAAGEPRWTPAMAVEADPAAMSSMSDDALEWVTSAIVGDTAENQSLRQPVPTPVAMPERRADSRTPAAVDVAVPEGHFGSPAAEPAAVGDPSVSSPGHNLARLAQRLAATRQPLPFVAAPLPSLAVVASAAPGSPETAGGGRPLGTSGESGAATATASQSWVGSLPELEPISIPDFELMIEHSAPSWAQSPPPQSAAPGSELRANKTLPVHLRAQSKAAAAELDQAVHISAPVPLEAEAASISLPPIEIEPPPPPPVLLPPPPAAARVRWGRAVAWVVAAMALFSLGVGLYWVRQELDRGINVSVPPPAPRALPAANHPQPAPAATPPTSAAAKEPEPALSAPVVPTAPADPSSAAASNQAAASDRVSGAAKQSASSAVAPDPSLPPTPGVATVQSPAAAAAGTDAATSPAGAVSPPPSGEFAALLTKARAFEHRGALTQAYHAVRGAQRLQPRSAEVFAILAQLSLDEANADKAAGLAKRALSLNKTNADAYLVLGTVEQARSHPAKARVYFKKYLELAPTGDRAVEVRAVLRLSPH